MSRILGINTRHYPTFFLHPGIDRDCEQIHGWSKNPPAVITVLVEGDIGDYAAYTGLGPPEWVADHGDKIRFEEAIIHFPGGQLVREKYRE